MTYESTFKKAVCEALAPLCKAFDFEQKTARNLEVVFENSKVRLVIAQRQIWDKICFNIGPINSSALYDLDAIAAWKGVEAIPMQVGDEDVLRRVVAKAASLLADSCTALLRGDVGDFSRLAAFWDKRNLAYNEKLLLNPVLSEAHEAWTEHRDGDVIDLLFPVSESLGPVDKLRLQLAAKYLEQQDRAK
jgi:hypothetical protein